VPGNDWFVMMRFYGPEQPYFDKTWRVPGLRTLRKLDLSGQEAGSNSSKRSDAPPPHSPLFTTSFEGFQQRRQDAHSLHDHESDGGSHETTHTADDAQHGPLKAYNDKSWKPDDVVLVK